MEQANHIKTGTAADYRDGYANSVQIRYSLWDFCLVFGMVKQEGQTLSIQNFQGIYLSPQHAKALASILQENLNTYEATFGTIHVEQVKVKSDSFEAVQ
jgi:hypothetical protein